MSTEDLIVVTGSLGFIGSCFISHLNRMGYHNIICVDNFDENIGYKNLENKSIVKKFNIFEFIDNLDNLDIRYVFHFGANSNTTEMNYEIHKKFNLEYTKKIWNHCVDNSIPIIYASSAATYGSGELGYDDNHEIISSLNPLNPYGISKNNFDIWAINQDKFPPFWTGLKFFNVYGPNEYHKGKMSSVIYHSYNQIRNNGEIKLFKSHNPLYKNGEQLRDFVYVKDVINICYWMMNNKPNSGIYNVGSGKARTFNDVAISIFNILNSPVKVNYIDTPKEIRDKYQYFTEANMSKLYNVGYPNNLFSLEEGVNDYINNFLNYNNYL